jgi:hypothetical protein
VTYYINCRSQAVAGSVVDPYLLQGDGTAPPPALKIIGRSEIPWLVSGRNLLIAVHGFNVSYQNGACSLGNLESWLRSIGGLTAADIYFGVLWPGDYWLPVVNYPFEGNVAADCGNRLAAFCNDQLASAQSISFVSHSLGVRVVLQAVAGLFRRARSVCLTAAAINRDCLVTEYAAAARNADAISILSSHNDMVLKLAFSVGDPIADLLHADHALFETALGYNGPPAPAGPPIQSPWQIPDGDGYGHGDYLPPSSGPLPDLSPDPKWPMSANFMARAYRAQPQSWP